jgi:hypothetical protein
MKRKKSTPPLKREALEIPPEVAERFYAYMRAFHAESNPIKADRIAGDAGHLFARALLGPAPPFRRKADVRADARGGRRLMKTVWIYINTDALPGDVEHLKVFASEDAAQASPSNIPCTNSPRRR